MSFTLKRLTGCRVACCGYLDPWFWARCRGHNAFSRWGAACARGLCGLKADVGALLEDTDVEQTEEFVSEIIAAQSPRRPDDGTAGAAARTAVVPLCSAVCRWGTTMHPHCLMFTWESVHTSVCAAGNVMAWQRFRSSANWVSGFDVSGGLRVYRNHRRFCSSQSF